MSVKHKGRGFGRLKRLEKGYKTRLNAYINKMGRGSIEYIAKKTGLYRTTVTKVAETGKGLKSVKEAIEVFLDNEAPIKKTIKTVEDVAA